MVEATGVHVDRGGTARRAAVVLCVATLTQLALCVPAFADAESDAKAVFCLSTGHRADLADAAVALDLPQFSDPFVWRREHPADFDRACGALFDAQKPSASSTFANLLPFLTGLLGAVLAFAAAAWRDRVARGRQTADALRAAVIAFHDSARSYLASWGATRSDEKLLTARGNLLTQLAIVRNDHRGWTRVRALEATLTEGALGASLSTGWTGQNEATRTRTAALTAELDQVRDGALTVARALGRPLLPQPGLKDGAP